jgi:hypothetical protein
MGSGSGRRKKRDTDPGVKIAPDPGSATQFTSFGTGLGAERTKTRLNMFRSDFVVVFSIYRTGTVQ